VRTLDISAVLQSAFGVVLDLSVVVRVGGFCPVDTQKLDSPESAHPDWLNQS